MGVILGFNSSSPLPGLPLAVLQRNPHIPSCPSLTCIRAHPPLDFWVSKVTGGGVGNVPERGHVGLELGNVRGGPGPRFLTAGRRSACAVTGKVGAEAVIRQSTAVGRVVGRRVRSKSSRRFGWLLAAEGTSAF